MAVEESNTVPLTITLPAAVHAELEYLTKLSDEEAEAVIASGVVAREPLSPPAE